jgi:hypothetical protein
MFLPAPTFHPWQPPPGPRLFVEITDEAPDAPYFQPTVPDALVTDIELGPAVHLDELTPDTAAKAEELANLAASNGYNIKFVSGLRTCAQQNQLYAVGRDSDGNVVEPGKIVTKAKGCVSWHVMGRALDFVFTDRKNPAKVDDYRVIGELAKSIGMKWGGDFPGFPDMVHVEYHPGHGIGDFCPDPNQCQAALEKSRSVDLRPADDTTLTPPTPENHDQPASETVEPEGWSGLQIGAVAILGASVLGLGYYAWKK